MPERSNQDIIRIVTKYQNAGLIHELTCAVDSRHLALEAAERAGKVVLVCPTCGEIQEDIPPFVLGSEALVDFSLRQWAEEAERARRRNALQDIWFAAAVILLCFSIIPFLVGGRLFGFIGAAVGIVVAYVYATRTFRKIMRAPDPESRP